MPLNYERKSSADLSGKTLIAAGNLDRVRLAAGPIAIAIMICLVMAGQAGQEWTLTASDGRTIQARIVSTNANSVTIRRKSDNEQFVIPLSTLSEADQSFLKSWLRNSNDQTQDEEVVDRRASSVSLRPNSGSIQRKSDPSPYQTPLQQRWRWRKQ